MEVEGTVDLTQDVAGTVGQGIPDAPSNGTRYGRQDVAWAADPIQGDAASDGNQYVRQNGLWVPLSAVETFNGRQPDGAGNIDPASGDYGTTDVTNQSGVAGANCTAAIDANAAAASGAQATIDGHIPNVSGHGDVSFMSPQSKDVLVWDSVSRAIANARVQQRFSGAFGLDAGSAGATIGPAVSWTELVPATVTLGTLKNVTYAAGRLALAYSLVDGLIGGAMVAHVSITFPTADTEFKMTFAIDGVPIPEADFIMQRVSNAASQTTGTGAALSFTLPFEDAPNGSEVSLVYQAANAVTLESYVLEIDGEPQTLIRVMS